MPDLKQIKAEALAKKDAAKQKIAASKREAENRKALKANPEKQFVQMPEVTGDAEKDSAADLDAVSAGFRARAKDEGKRRRLATDSEYWACVCFQTREQKEAFLAALNLLQFGDKYLDGQAVAKELGVKLPSADVPFNTGSKIDPDWVKFTER